jgi:SAM-dependent methyltransferase
MEAEVYERMAVLEAGHWWFRGRRRVLETLMGRIEPAGKPPRILEAGCGTGGNLPMLERHGTVKAFEPDPRARDLARSKGYPVEAGSLPEACPFDGERFDWILMPDVLEHIEDDRAALEVLSRKLAPGGNLLLTVPAFPVLWSAHDTIHHHFRRYRRKQLAVLLSGTGLRIRVLHYYNFWLFPPILAVRLLKRGRAAANSDDAAIPPAPLNRMLEWIFSSERRFVGRPGFPFGVSLIALASRPE